MLPGCVPVKTTIKLDLEPRRFGGHIQTYTGRRFYPLDPRPDEIDIKDIAHALAMICRFGGHCMWHYSVGEHSIRVARQFLGKGREAMAYALLHDAAEAYLGDMQRPVKYMPEMTEYRIAEGRLELAIWERFGLSSKPSPLITDAIKGMDNILLATEKRDLMSDKKTCDWGPDNNGVAPGVEPLPAMITPRPPLQIEYLFLEMAEDLHLS